MQYKETIKAGVYAVDGLSVVLEPVAVSGVVSQFIRLTVSPQEAEAFSYKIGEVVEIEKV